MANYMARLALSTGRSNAMLGYRSFFHSSGAFSQDVVNRRLQFGGGFADSDKPFLADESSPKVLLSLIQLKAKGGGNLPRKSELLMLAKRVLEEGAGEEDDNGVGKNGKLLLMALDLNKGSPLDSRTAAKLVKAAVAGGADTAAIAKAIIRDKSLRDTISSNAVKGMIGTLRDQISLIEDKESEEGKELAKKNVGLIQDLVDFLDARAKKSKNGRLPPGMGPSNKTHIWAALAFVSAGQEGRARILLQKNRVELSDVQEAFIFGEKEAEDGEAEDDGEAEGEVKK